MGPIPYGRQSIEEEDIKAVVDTLKSDYLTQGPRVEEFEKLFAEFVGAKHAVAVINGTAALHLAALALNVRPGDKVLVPSNTFAASANCILYCGGEVEFVDIEPQTYCMDLSALEAKLAAAAPGTYKGIVTVDFAGYPVDTEKLRGIANKYKLWIIEDACHAIGASFTNSKNQIVRSGSCMYSDISVFSFHPVKHIATGEGGIITTNNSATAETLRLLRTHGIQKNPDKFENPADGGWSYEMQMLGFNYRIPDILCALGTSQLKRIDKNLKRRREIAARYNQELSGLPIVLPKLGSGLEHGYHLFVIQTDKRKELYGFLREKSIFSQVLYIPVHKQPYYQKRYASVKLPETEAYYSRTLALPMYHGLTSDDQSKVIAAVKEFFSK